MNTTLPFQFSETVAAAGLALPFGIVTASGVSAERLADHVERNRQSALEDVRSRLTEIRARMNSFDDFFRQRGFACPLPGQLRGVERKGFPRISPFVDALLMCEMQHGVLMGVQDRDQIRGVVTYDIAHGGETFAGLRETVVCRTGEIILRDEHAFFASYFQGPDQRTSVTPTTSDLVFFVFSAPGLDEKALDDALKAASNLVGPAAEVTDWTLFRV